MRLLFNRLYNLAQNPELRTRLGEQAAAAARSYDWDIITNQMIRLYDDTLKHPCLVSNRVSTLEHPETRYFCLLFSVYQIHE